MARDPHYQILGLNKSDPRNLKSGEYALLKNLRVSHNTDGNPHWLEKDLGQQVISTTLPANGLAGIRYALKNSQRYTVVHCSDGSYRYRDSSDTWQLLDHGYPSPAGDQLKANFPTISTTNPARFTVFKDLLFMVDGINYPIKWNPNDGYLAYVGLPQPTAPTATTDTTKQSPLNDIVAYGITYVSHFGESELGITSPNVVTNFNQIDLTNIPLAPAQYDVIARNIYRWRESSQVFQLLDTIWDNTTTTYTDKYGADKESSQVVTNDQPPQGCNFIVSNENTLMIGGSPDFPNRWYYCNANEFEFWNLASQYFDITEKATGGFYWRGSFYLTSRNTVSIYSVGSAPRKLEAEHGCINDRTIVMTSTFVYWLSPQGYVRFNGSFTQLISNPFISPQLNAVIETNPQGVQCVMKDDIVRLSIFPTIANPLYHEVYYYDTLTNIWTGARMNMPVAFWIHYDNVFDNNELMYVSWNSSSNTNEPVMIQVDIGNQDVKASDSSFSVIPIDWEIDTKWHYEPDPQAIKCFNTSLFDIRGKNLSFSVQSISEGVYSTSLTQDTPQNFTIPDLETADNQASFSSIASGTQLTETLFPQGYRRLITVPFSVDASYALGIMSKIVGSDSTDYFRFYGYEIIYKVMRMARDTINVGT